MIDHIFQFFLFFLKKEKEKSAWYLKYQDFLARLKQKISTSYQRLFSG